MAWFFLSALLISSVAIAYQDFRSRLISLGWIICFGTACVGSGLLRYKLDGVIENAVFCLVYLIFSYLVLHLFYFIKAGKFQKVLDSKIGWGDVILLLLEGFCLQPQTMIYFFTLTFIIALVFQFIFQKQKKDIALGAVLVVCYSVYQLIQIIYT